MGLIRRTRRCHDDLFDIWSYISRNNQSAADRLLGRFDHQLAWLSDFPLSGTRRDDLGKKVRMLPVGSYLVIYRPIRSGIEVLRIVHGARDLHHLFKR